MEEFPNDLTDDEFIEFVNQQNRFGFEEIPSEPETQPRNLSDGLREWIDSQAVRPLPEKSTGDEKSVYLEASWDENIEDYEKNHDWEKEKQELLEESARTPLYDFGTGKMSNERAMTDFYGAKIVSRIEKEIRESCEMPDRERKNGHISTELWRELRDIRAGKKPRSSSATKKESARNQSPVTQINDEKKPAEKPKEQKSREIKVVQRQRQKGDDYYLKTERGIIRNETYREVFKGPGVVYEWLWTNLVRSEWIDTKGYPIKEKYYDKGLLAYCSTFKKIGKDCGMSKNTVKKYIDHFQKVGIIKIKNLVPDGMKRGQSVFILGAWSMENGDYVERFYRDEIFLSGKNGQNLPN